MKNNAHVEPNASKKHDMEQRRRAKVAEEKINFDDSFLIRSSHGFCCDYCRCEDESHVPFNSNQHRARNFAAEKPSSANELLISFFTPAKRRKKSSVEMKSFRLENHDVSCLVKRLNA